MLFHKLMIFYPTTFQIQPTVQTQLAQDKWKNNAIAMFVIKMQSVKKEENSGGFGTVNWRHHWNHSHFPLSPFQLFRLLRSTYTDRLPWVFSQWVSLTWPIFQVPICIYSGVHDVRTRLINSKGLQGIKTEEKGRQQFRNRQSYSN